jgi:hypothetical protein
MILRRTQTGPTPNANYNSASYSDHDRNTNSDPNADGNSDDCSYAESDPNAKAASDAASSPDTVKIIAASI